MPTKILPVRIPPTYLDEAEHALTNVNLQIPQDVAKAFMWWATQYFRPWNIVDGVWVDAEDHWYTLDEMFESFLDARKEAFGVLSYTFDIPEEFEMAFSKISAGFIAWARVYYGSLGDAFEHLLRVVPLLTDKHAGELQFLRFKLREELLYIEGPFVLVFRSPVVAPRPGDPVYR